jgi:GNAT superfamily N-acetyltransferase
MIRIHHTHGDLSAHDQGAINAGFTRHTAEVAAPPYKKERLNWLARDSSNSLVGAVTADLLWDWIYIDELWTAESHRGTGLGRRLMETAEEFATSRALTGIWLWTQSWQAADFYRHLGYAEFARFDDFPRGHTRVGFRKMIRLDQTSNASRTPSS